LSLVGKNGTAKIFVFIIVQLCAFMTFHSFVGKPVEFNISWLRRGHPVLNIGDLKIEASHSVGLLLDQLRFSNVKSLSNSVIIVLIKRYLIFFFTPFGFLSNVTDSLLLM